MAMAYRTDLFKQAGLPVDRDKVSALWPTWDDYIKVGKQYKAKLPKSAFFESSGNMFRAMIGQAQEGMYNTNDEIIADKNPAVKAAFDKTVEAINANMSAKLAAWTPEWTAGFDKGAFATIVAPAWMLSYIEGNAKNASGKWDIAKVPGGGGNMGGSHLVVPKQTKHAKEAAELVKFLTAPEQQLKVFKKTGNFPSTPELYNTPDIQNFSKAYFNNAPIGKIYADAAQALHPQYLGPKDGDLMTAVGQGLGRVEDKKQTGQQAWVQALKDVEKLKNK
jgi:cellobiose transport system substrate-binding protein